MDSGSRGHRGVSLASAARADEKMSAVQTALSNTTLSGYVDVSAQ